MSSMPFDYNSWEAKLTKSLQSFETDVNEPAGEIYFMVMVDPETDKIVGTTAIYAGVGLDQPFFSYKVSKLVSFSKELDKKNEMEVLHLVNDFTGATEIGSLYLAPDYRKNKNGSFLSRCRFLMIHDFPDRFGQPIIAEMRGWQNEDGHSPFWEDLGRKFFGLGFENADFMSSVHGNQFITDLMPRHPIYTDLLPAASREVIGKPHEASAPALRMLEKEGFRKSGYIDIFDGGPTVQCQSQNIATIRDTKISPISQIVEDRSLAEQPRQLISNQRIDNYRLMYAPVKYQEDDTVTIDKSTAKILGLSLGDMVSHVE